MFSHIPITLSGDHGMLVSLLFSFAITNICEFAKNSLLKICESYLLRKVDLSENLHIAHSQTLSS